MEMKPLPFSACFLGARLRRVTSVRRVVVSMLAALAVTAGCDTKRPAEPAPAPTDARTEARPQARTDRSASEPERPFRFPAPERLVAIGDLHGDLEATRRVLRLAGAIDAEDRWIGGSLVVVQTGDQLDRGDGERGILELLSRLEAEARAAGGALHVLNGNHETMNVQGDFRYVTEGARNAFDDAEPRSSWASRFPGALRGRAGAFLPGGQYAKLLAERDVVVVVGGTVFAHAGVRAPHVDHGIGKLNAETRAWMRGDREQPPRLIADPEGPVWTRVYGDETLDEHACAVLSRALEKVQARRMVIGHTVQSRGVTSACGERVWRIDVGLARHYGGRTEALEIRGDQVRVLRDEASVPASSRTP